MDLTAIQTFVGAFGFPIFMCLLMAWYINSTHKQLTDAMYALNRTMKAVLQELGLKDDQEDK